MTLEQNIWYRFGTKSLSAKMIKSGLLALVIIIGVIVAQIAIGSAMTDVSAEWMDGVQKWINMGLWGIGILFIAFQFVVAWIDYMYRELMISDSALYLRSGFLMRTETSSPYRFIVNVSEKQGIIDRMLGVSGFVVELVPDEKDNEHSDHIVLHDMDAEMGDALQDILLDHANMQKMKMTE